MPRILPLAVVALVSSNHTASTTTGNGVVPFAADDGSSTIQSASTRPSGAPFVMVIV
jgi:hypothetical protein